jgi:valyl-tRNA synthetase
LSPQLSLTQDSDVLDTWFSSSLWTFVTLGWPDATKELSQFHPTNTLVTGHDIIFFWVARMIMMTLKFTGEIPFKQVYIHGLVRDADGDKMSKTKGNGLDPLDLIDGITLDKLVEKRTADLTQPKMASQIEKRTRRDFPDGVPSYGTDALRFTYCAMASTGRDLRFDLNRIEGYRNFCNKLWNASRFVLLNCADVELDGPTELSIVDRWVLARINGLIASSERAINTYRFDVFANAVYEFAWHEYCDWYLELTKPLLWDEGASPAQLRGTRLTLLRALEALLRIAHPIIPFITESIWREISPLLGNDASTIMLQGVPDPLEFPTDDEADTAVEWLKGVIVGVRNIRGEANVKPGKAINLLLQPVTDESTKSHRILADANDALLKRLANIDEIQWLAAADEPPLNALVLVGDLKVMVPLAGLIDIQAERIRLGKEVARKEKELLGVERKLANSSFVEKAPAEVVAKQRRRAEELAAALVTLRAQLNSLDDL